MQPTSFTCTRCNAPLPVGVIQCPNCGMAFNAPVPPSPMPGYGAPPAKKGLPALAIAGIVAAVGCLPVMILAAILFPVFAKVREKARETSSASNLKQLGLATMQYMQDHNETYPPMDTMDHYKAALSTYVKDDPQHSLFVQTGENVPYILNSKLSKVNLALIDDPANTVVAKEAVPHQGGLIAVLYVSGRVHFEHQESVRF